mgnify:CR=1 FL=1
MKIVVLTIVLFAAALQSSAAKEERVHHDHHAGGTAASAPKGPEKPATTSAKGANSDQPKPSDPIDAGVTELPPSAGLTPKKAPDASANVKIAKPGNFPGPGTNLGGPAKPVLRNAIGQIVAPHEALATGGERFGPARQAAAAISSGAIGSAYPGGRIVPNGARQNFSPVVAASLAGRIDGTKLIRPSAAASGIGGPAKRLGINGTTFRPKR